MAAARQISWADEYFVFTCVSRPDASEYRDDVEQNDTNLSGVAEIIPLFGELADMLQDAVADASIAPIDVKITAFTLAGALG
ncbi:hypothetical protein HHL08_23180 [Sphingobium sp. AR-3-1]|uniref:Uncharacterized protein n=1 Tax=Sphingobium psychrophilum TaxID=2728834 RepID=A0A7X9ZW37_9SPHN|nr:hypothetical protein [Sphingobium psychrophilum]NML12999.1 hypothetical protein [Sphingobium psychrophilum]